MVLQDNKLRDVIVIFSDVRNKGHVYLGTVIFF